jgi:hypothetical protein
MYSSTRFLLGLMMAIAVVAAASPRSWQPAAASVDRLSSSPRTAMQATGSGDDWRGRWNARAKWQITSDSVQGEILDLIRGTVEPGPDDFIEDDVTIEFTFHVRDGGVVQGSGTATVTPFGGQFGFCAIRDQQSPASVPVRVSGAYMGGQFTLSLNPTGPAAMRTREWNCDVPLLLRPLEALRDLVGNNVTTYENVGQLGHAMSEAAQTFMIPAQDGGTANPYVILENRTISVEAVIHQIPYEGTWNVEGTHMAPDVQSRETVAADIRFRVAGDNTISGDGTARVTKGPDSTTQIVMGQAVSCTVTHAPSMFSAPVRVLGRREGDNLRLELQPVNPPAVTETVLPPCSPGPYVATWPESSIAGLGLGSMGLTPIVVPVMDLRADLTIPNLPWEQAVVAVRLQRPPQP